MKANAARRSFVTQAVPTEQSQPGACAAATTPLLRPRPFLVQALRLRSRRSAR